MKIKKLGDSGALQHCAQETGDRTGNVSPLEYKYKFSSGLQEAD